MFLLDDDMSRCTEQEVTRLLRAVPAPRREEALHYKHLFGRYCCLRSYEMLDELLGRVGKTMSRWRYNEYGKPYLDNGMFFSISHCKRAILVAIDERETGVDVESVRKADDALVKRTMNEAEQAAIARSDMPDEAFIALWTQKEAVVKMRGTGILDDLHDVLCGERDYMLDTVTERDKGYVYSIAVRNE